MSEKKRYDVWTYASANSVTVSGDMTGTYWPGMKVALKQGTIKYFVIFIFFIDVFFRFNRPVCNGYPNKFIARNVFYD